MEIKNFKDEINKQFSDMNDRIKKLETSKPNVSAAVEKSVSEKIGSKIVEEQMLVEKKKDNLIYFHIPESASDDIAERRNIFSGCF